MSAAIVKIATTVAGLFFLAGLVVGLWLAQIAGVWL